MLTAGGQHIISCITLFSGWNKPLKADNPLIQYIPHVKRAYEMLSLCSKHFIFKMTYYSIFGKECLVFGKKYVAPYGVYLSQSLCPLMVLVLLSSSAGRFGVSCMRDIFVLYCIHSTICILQEIQCLPYARFFLVTIAYAPKQQYLANCCLQLRVSEESSFPSLLLWLF